MHFENLLINETESVTTLTINRLKNQNSINRALLKELHHALDMTEDKPENKAIVLKGQEGIFCTGMDFEEMISWDFSEEHIRDWAMLYMSLLRRFAASSNIIITLLDGKVFAGGTGLVAASDYVVATSRSQFKLTETLWGLLPAMVAPYLIRRTGFQKAYTMTLLAKTLTAKEAHDINLVDEISDAPEEAIQQLLKRLNRLNTATVEELKAYFKKMWIVDSSVEETAVDEIAKLLQNPQTQANIRSFVTTRQVPWK